MAESQAPIQPLSLDRFAELTAEIELGTPKDKVLAAAGVSEAAWDRTQTFWLTKIAAQVKAQSFGLHSRWSALLLDARKKVTARQKLERRKLSGPAPVAPVNVISPLLARPSAMPAPRASMRPNLPLSAPPQPRISQAPPSHGPQSYPPPAYSAQSYPPPSRAPQSLPPQSSPPVARVSQPPPSHQPAPQSAAQVARLTLQQFASLRAELATSPESNHAEALERNGLNRGTWSQEEAAWQQRFADKAVFQQYLQQFQYFRALMMPRT